MQLSSLCRHGIGVSLLLIGLAACAPSPQDLLTRARSEFAKGDLRAAEIDLKSLLQNDSRNASARALLARVLAESGDIAAARIELQKAKDAGAAKSDTLAVECQTWLASGAFDQVLAECAADRGAPGDKSSLQILRGRALLGLSRDREARDLFALVFQADPGNLAALVGQAQAAATVDGLAAGRKVLEAATGPVRSAPQYWLAVGGLSAEDGDLVAAQAAYKQAVDSVPKNADLALRLVPMAELAVIHLRRGQLAEATAATAQLQKMAPDNWLVKRLQGQVAAAAGRLPEARTVLDAVVARNPKDTQALLVLGEVNARLGNLEQAQSQFESVVSQQPDNALAQRALQQVRAMRNAKAAGGGASAPALADIAGLSLVASSSRSTTQAAGDALGDASILLAAGDIGAAVAKLQSSAASGMEREAIEILELLRAGTVDKAVAQLAGFLQHTADSPALRNFAGSVNLVAGQPDAARAEYERALRQAPNNNHTELNLARLDLLQRQPAAAEKHFRAVAQRDPGNLLATLGVAVAARAQGNAQVADEWLQKANKEHPQSIDAKLALAQLYLGSGNLDTARATLDQAAQQAPNNAVVSNARGLVALAVKDWPAAIASFEKALAKDPHNAGYALNLARTQLLRRDLGAALKVLDSALASQPNLQPALVLAAAISLQAAKPEQARGYVDRLKKLAPDASLTAVFEGDIAMQHKRFAEALAHFRRAAANGSNTALVLSQFRASVLAGEKDPEQVLRTWLAANPRDVTINLVMAERHMLAADNAGAIKVYERILDASPDNVVALNNLAALYQAKGDARALEVAKKANALAPTSPQVQDTYGWILLSTGRVDEGFALLRDAIRRTPDIAEVRYHYAVALARKGNKTEAVEQLQTALAGSLTASAKADAEKLLDEIRK